MLSRCLTLVLALLALPAVRAEEPASPPDAPPAEATAAPAPEGPPVQNTLELQVELHRRGFSCGSIDGVLGAQTAGALRAFQRGCGIAETGVLDAATRERIRLSAPVLAEHIFAPDELTILHRVPETWVEKAELTSLAYATPLEFVAELYHAHPNLIQRLNPKADWTRVLPGAKVVVPAIGDAVVDGTAAQVVITLAARELDVLDETSRVIAHFPVSIARMAEKRPVGGLHITVIIPNPDYTFDPAVFPESAEARTLTHKLIVPPGPNNPVGVAWIGLSRQGYGIHGTPDPEKVGRTESHGCFRLANWDALTLMRLVHVGTPVMVEP